MKKILILYFSGAGATKKVAELMQSYLLQSQDCAADLFSVEKFTGSHIDNYYALIIGTPVYHGAPCRLIRDYFDCLPPLTKPIPAFIYHTRALCSCNTNRILAKQIQAKNIITVTDRAYRSPASDGALIVPFIRRFFQFERHLDQKIDSDCTDFLKSLEASVIPGYIPRFRFSSLINAPNKLAGQLTTFQIYLHRDKCIRCGKCIEHCPHHALEKNDSGYPIFSIKKCENCYRCIHHCPAKALSLHRHKAPKKLLTFHAND